MSTPKQKAAAPVPVDLVTYYTEAGMDYRAWSRNFNMHFGFYRWGMNPLALESMLEEMSRQVFRRLALGDGMKVLDLGCGLGAPARALIQQHDVAATAVTKVEWQLAMARKLSQGIPALGTVDWKLGDFTALDLPGGAFQAAFSIEACCHANSHSARTALSCRLGRRRWRPWTVRQVTSTRDPPAGMNRGHPFGAVFHSLELISRFRPFVLNRFIVVSGLPASGKSTLGREVARAMRLALLDKDEILESLFESLGVGDSDWRGRLSRAADEQLRKEACASKGAVIASWWKHPQSPVDSGTPSEWLVSLPGELVELHCRCSPGVAASRFLARKRHAGHLDTLRTHAALVANFEEQAALGPLNVGRVIQIDTEAMPALSEIISKMAWPLHHLIDPE